MISEHFIEQTINDIDSQGESFDDAFLDHHQEFLAYLNKEIIRSLTDVESKTLLFCCSIIYNTIILVNKEVIDFDIEAYIEYDERNWGVRDKNTKFEISKDILFDAYSEEDLLAFVEDMTTDDEDHLTEVGKEIIFITCKSYIDFLLGLN